MFRTLLSASLVLLTIASSAQNDKSKKVKTKYLSLPAYDVSVTNPSSIKLEFAMSDVSFGSEKLKDTKSKCVPKGGGVKDIIEVTAYHYEVPITIPESYIVAKSEDGTIVYAAKASEITASSARFGWDDKMGQSLCEYWQVDKLKKDWASKSNAFKSSEARTCEDRIYQEAYEKAVLSVSMNYVEEEFEVYSAKGKSFDYTALDAAAEKAIEAYESIAKEGYNDEDFAALKAAIAVWEAELSTADLEDKKARINKDIAKGLEENCTRAYFHIMDYDNAKEHAAAFAELFGNFSNNRSNELVSEGNKIRLQSVAASKNETSIGDLAGLHAKASASNDGVSGEKLESSNVDRLKSEYETMQFEQNIALAEELKKDEEAAIASGELNPYQKYYIEAAAGGEGVIMNLPPSSFSGTPELTEFPIEICEFVEAEQVMILNNKIASIPAEISKMTNLKKLDLSGNHLTTLPAEIGMLTNLKTLKLNNNPLESLPTELSNCKNLKTLSLKGTKVSSEQVKALQAQLPDCKIKM